MGLRELAALASVYVVPTTVAPLDRVYWVAVGVNPPATV